MAVASSERPKRRAASSNINYKENTETDSFDSVLSDSSKNKRQRRGGSTSSSTSSSSNSSRYGTTSGTAINDTKSPQIKDSSSDDNNPIPWNWQPPFKESDFFNNHLDVKNSKVENNTLTTRDGFKINKNDCIYMISEPPGEPYYIGRVVGFTKKDKNLTTKNASNYLFKMNWFYRPRDLNQKTSDTRLLYATMHSDNCPLQSFRGIVNLKHRSEIKDLDEFRQHPNNFYFDKLFDRYMIKYYEILPTLNLVNLPPNYYKALNKRFPYVFVEIGRGKDLLSAPKNCEKCYQWCSSMDSVMCINCENYYHMMCLDPPLMRKPLRGFGWSCALCNKELESKLNKDRGEMLTTSSLSKINSSRNTSVELEEDITNEEEVQEVIEKDEVHSIPRYEELAILFLAKDKALSLKQRRNLEEWPYRYLGMHVKLEDAMDLQDRPYARSASRLGSKHQLTGMEDWVGHPIQYYDPDMSQLSSQQSQQKKKKSNNKKKNSPSPSNADTELQDHKKLSVPQQFANIDPSEFPPWLQERPKGYIERGGDDTSKLMWKMPTEDDNIDISVFKIKLDEYMKRCSTIAKNLKLLPSTPNFMDAILKNYLDNGYNLEPAYSDSLKLTRDSLKEPTLTLDEIARFEEGVRKYGSELYPVYQEVKTKSSADIVRFYYLWKKTPNGHKIWDNYEGRAKNKLKNSNKLSNGAVDSVADSGDDSSYDSSKITKAKRQCECKHCHTNNSVQWFRVTGHNKAPSNTDEAIIGLCVRCAKLWRRYAVSWEDPQEVLKKQQQRGGNGWKRKIEYELLVDAEKIAEARNKSAQAGIKKAKSTSPVKDIKPQRNSTPLPDLTKKTLEVKLNLKKTPTNKKTSQKKKIPLPAEVLTPPPKKTYKLETPISSVPLFKLNPNYTYHEQKTKQIAPVQTQQVSFTPEQRPCAVCRTNDNIQDIVICSNCGLNVHKVCYGVTNKKVTSLSIWNCDCCLNDINPIYSTNYTCQLCVTKNFNYDDILKGLPNQFPDLLKYTSENKWCHLICGVFNKFCKIANLNTHSPFLNIPKLVHENSENLQNCQICHYHEGSMTKCEFCEDEYHVTCAQNNNSSFFIGFLLIPCDYKDKSCIQIQEFIYGVPKPVIVCNKHFQNQPLPPQFVPLRIPGRRVNSTVKSGSQEQPLISLYIQDCKKNEETSMASLPVLPTPPISQRSCDKCHTLKSIIFLKHEDHNLCHSCYSDINNGNYQIEKQNYSRYANDAMKLYNLINSPLPNNSLTIPLKQEPLVPEVKTEPKPFSKIRINDILS